MRGQVTNASRRGSRARDRSALQLFDRYSASTAIFDMDTPPPGLPQRELEIIL